MANAVLLLVCFVGTLTAVSSAGILGNFVSFPYAESPCNCSFLSCTCCTGIKVAKVGFSKNLCVLVSVGLFTMNVDVTVKLDSKTLTSFSFSANSPPTYCVPIALPVKIAMCLKIHDVKLIGLSGLQVCMTIYASYGKNNVVIPLNCITLTSGALKYVKTTSTSSTTSTTTTTTPRTTTTTTTPSTTTPTTTTTTKKGKAR